MEDHLLYFARFDHRGWIAARDSGRKLRQRRGRGKIVGAGPIGSRSTKAEGRLVPGNREGDLILGSTSSGSAIGTTVKRMTGCLPMLHMSGRHDG